MNKRSALSTISPEAGAPQQSKGLRRRVKRKPGSSRQPINYHTSPENHVTMKRFAFENDTSLQAIIDEALFQFFKDQGAYDFKMPELPGKAQEDEAA